LNSFSGGGMAKKEAIIISIRGTVASGRGGGGAFLDLFYYNLSIVAIHMQ